MCNPLIIGAALLAGGTGAQIIGNNKAKNAVRDTLAMEQARQKRMTAQQDEALSQSMRSAQNLNDDSVRQQAIDHRKNAFMAALAGSPAVSSEAPLAGSAPAVVGEYANRVGAAEQAAMGQQAAALANMTGFGDTLFNTQVGIGRSGDAISQIARDKAFSADILNNELTAAQAKGSTLRGLGGLAAQIGGMMIGSNIKFGGGIGKAAKLNVGQSKMLGTGALGGPLG